MGMVMMSKRELNRLDVLARLDSDRLTPRAAAELMAITPRQTYRLLRRYRDGGASAVANQRRGRLSNNRLPDVVRDHAIALVRERYTDFGPTFAGEKLAELHDLKVARETLRSWMRQAVCVPKIRFCNIDGEGRQGQVVRRRRRGAQPRDGEGRPCSEIDGSSTHYNRRHIRGGSGAGALLQTRSCGRDIRGGSSR